MVVSIYLTHVARRFGARQSIAVEEGFARVKKLRLSIMVAVLNFCMK